MPDNALRPYRDDDHEAVAALLADALADDPAYGYLLGEQAREGLHFLMPRLLELRRAAGARIDVHELDGRCAGALVTAPPDLHLSTLGYLRNGLLRAPGKLGVRSTFRLLAADRALQKLKALARPDVPHVEAVSFAVDRQRARGHGLRMAREGLAQIDCPVLAVTTSDRNVRLYRHLGFEVVVQDGILGGFTAWVMVRR